jgi:hypothetical protein
MPAGQPKRNESQSSKDANLEKMRACLEATEAYLGKTEAMIKACQEQIRAEIKAGLEEMKPTELEANQGEIGAGGEHYTLKACTFLLRCRARLLDVLHGDPKGATYEKTAGDLKTDLETSTWLQRMALS